MSSLKTQQRSQVAARERVVSFILIGVLVLVVILMIASAIHKDRPRVTKRDIGALDFDKVHAQLKSRKGWEDERIEAADAEYRKFLWLLARYPGEMMVPWNQDMDEFWHQHILNTANYTAMCKKLFGKYIDHTPEDEGNAAAQHQASHKTSERYQREFDKGRTTNGATTQDSGCSATVYAACGSNDSGSHHDSGSHGGGHDGGSGHSCSSHSCSSGGHSCGGHGCSSGCGGGGCGGD